MKVDLIARWQVRLIALVVIVGGLLIWLFRPVGIPPAAQLRDAASVAWFLLGIAAGAGVAAMATVQFWKVLFLPRAAFHDVELKSFFCESTFQVLGLAGPTPKDAAPAPPPAPKAVEHLLDNPTEVVMGQLRSSADYILLRPQGFEDALRRLAGDAGRVAVERYLEQQKEGPSSKDDSLVEVRFFVEQYLNLVHASLKERWRRRVRTLAVVVAGSTGLLTVTLSNLGPLAKVSTIFAAAIWGGFFSWLARDLVALVERRRT
jgi:hypothetical protein